MKYFYIITFFSFIVACNSSVVYDEFVNMEDAYWHANASQHFDFEIKDVSAYYKIYVTFRNASSYPFYNLYFQYTLSDSSHQTLYKDLVSVNLFNPKTGRPYGDGLGDLFDHTFQIKEHYKFKDAGKYQLTLQQFMRMDTLPFILSVGTRVVKEEN